MKPSQTIRIMRKSIGSPTWDYLYLVLNFYEDDCTMRTLSPVANVAAAEAI